MLKSFSILRPVLAILILFIPLYPKFPLANVSGTYVAIRLDDIVVAISLMFLIIYQIKNKFSIFKQKITILMLCYYLAIVASFVTAFLIYQTEPPQILMLHLLRRFEYTALLFLTISTVRTIKDFKWAYLFLLTANIGVILYGYGQKYLRLPVVSTMNSEFSKGQLLQMDIWTRISSTFAGHYDLAAFLSVILIIIGGVFVTSKNRLTKFTSLTIWIFSYHILTLTASRVSIFAFIGGICLTLFLLKKYLYIIPIIILVTFSIFNSKDLNQRLLATIPALQKQFFRPSGGSVSNRPTTVLPSPTIPIIAAITPGQVRPQPTAVPTVFRHGPIDEFIPIDADVGVARSGEIRFNAEWPRAVTAYRKNPITGTGLGSITLATDNDYLRLLGESGILGFSTFLLIFVYFTIKTIPSIFSKKPSLVQKFHIIFFGSMITFLINATLIDVFEASKTAYMFWIMMGFYNQSFEIKSE